MRWMRARSSRKRIDSSLARYEPERLGSLYRQRTPLLGRAEFFSLLLNADPAPVPLPTAPLNEVLNTTRLIFGSETIEYRLPTQTRFGAILGIKEYATPTTVGMYNALLSAPFEFVLTQSFAFLTKAHEPRAAATPVQPDVERRRLLRSARPRN